MTFGANPKVSTDSVMRFAEKPPKAPVESKPPPEALDPESMRFFHSRKDEPSWRLKVSPAQYGSLGAIDTGCVSLVFWFTTKFPVVRNQLFEVPREESACS